MKQRKLFYFAMPSSWKLVNWSSAVSELFIEEANFLSVQILAASICTKRQQKVDKLNMLNKYDHKLLLNILYYYLQQMTESL